MGIRAQDLPTFAWVSQQRRLDQRRADDAWDQPPGAHCGEIEDPACLISRLRWRDSSPRIHTRLRRAGCADDTLGHCPGVLRW